MIHPFLQTHTAAINNLCQRYSVLTLHAFGSVTSEAFDENSSDVDFLVELPDSLTPEHKGDTYFQLLLELETLLNRRVDLILGQSFRNPYFARAVEQTKQLVYAA